MNAGNESILNLAKRAKNTFEIIANKIHTHEI